MMLCLLFGILGLVLGSFLNVCIVRLPVGESVVWPRSHCRQCDRPIASWDNIPVLSWILLGASCRACGGRISWRYPAVEAIACFLFVMCCLKFPAGLACAWAALCFLLLGLAVMDAETLLLPDPFTLGGLALGLVFAGVRPGIETGNWSWNTSLHAVGVAALAAVLAASLLLVIAGTYWLTRRRMGMGLGDVKLLAMLGAWLGWKQTLLVLFLAVIAGALYGVVMIVVNRRQERNDPLPTGLLPVPFGTMLSAAGLYSIFLGQRTLDWYLQFFH
jgi:leader peptidase (prepilin peptidase) / N-methyltransferase